MCNRDETENILISPAAILVIDESRIQHLEVM